MPGDDDDDTTTTGGSHPGGSLSYWLKYSVWGTPGYVLILVALAIGATVGYFAR